ncbi:MAG: NAD+ synthase [Tissierellia bacterium]|nr:NAD+ synthase [Tissierellia bacterium]
MDYKKIKDDIVKWLKMEVENANAKGVVFGLSGGIDSAVVAGLSKEAFGEDALGIIMPINSNPDDKKDALLVADSLNLNIEEIDLTSTFNEYLNNIEQFNNKLAISNIKPRLRMITLYYYAQSKNYLVLGCSNLSEFLTGYFTKYGDSGSDLMPIADLVKTDVWELAKVLNIPEKIINKKPSAGLWENQTDEDEMGVTYRELDSYILGKEISDESRNKITKMINKSKHKRSFAKIYKVSRN